MDAATVFGNSPGIATGAPFISRQVGSDADIDIIVNVFEPALTANKFCESSAGCATTASEIVF
jgi:hypothetical protein